MSILNAILEIVFPSKCSSCGENGIELCLKCLKDCPQAERESASWIFPLFDYRHPPIKKAIVLMKYKNKKNIANLFGDILYDRMLEELSELSTMENFKEAILIPIPLSKRRLRERGYNQAELICNKLIKIDEERNPKEEERNFKLKNNILIKIKDEEHQARINSRRERLKNIINSFAVKNPETIKNKNIILIDDVTTTGATLEEAKKTLKKAGVRKIIAFTIAH